MKGFRDRWLAPPEPEYAAAGDLLRVVCILMVGWYHIWQQSWLGPVLKLGGRWLDFTPGVRAGYMFVDMMLALSGFLCYLPYANGKARPAGEFYLRRALRILPSYWLCLMVMLVFALRDPGFTDAPRLGLDLLAHLGFVQNLWGFSYTATRMNVVLWTLAVEVQFYLLLPVLAPVFKKRPLLTYAALTGAGLSFMFLWTAPMQDTVLFVNRLPNFLDVYAAGILAAMVFVRLSERQETSAGAEKVLWKKYALQALATAVFAAALYGLLRMLMFQASTPDYVTIQRRQMIYRPFYALFFTCLILSAPFALLPLRKLLGNPVTKFLGGISMNYYLIHQTVIVHMRRLRFPYSVSETPHMEGEQPWQTRYTLLAFGISLLLAVLVTYLVEKPAARLLDRWRARNEKRRL